VIPERIIFVSRGITVIEKKDWIKGNKKKKDKPEPTNKVTHDPKEATRDKVKKNFEVFSFDPK
jgi:hypothetical protein